MDSFFDAISPDGHPVFVADLPNEQGGDKPYHQYVRSEQELQRFIAVHDKPGRALYFTVAHLAEGAWRTKDAVSASHWVWAEVDFKDHPDLTPEEILRRILAAPRRPNLVTFSGHGYHTFWRLPEPVDARPGAAQQQLEDVLRLACAYVGGDPQVAEASRLMRLPGSHNTRKAGESLQAKVVHLDNLSCELGDLLDFFLEVPPILPAPSPREKANGHAGVEIQSEGGPVDVEAALADMEFESSKGTGVNATVCRVIPSLLRRGEHPDDVLERVVSAVMGMAKRCRLKWSETVEIKATRKRILSAYNNLLLRDYDPATGEIPGWLPGDFHKRWAEVLTEGGCPTFGFNRGGFYVRKAQAAEPAAKARAAGSTQEPAATGGASPASEPSGWSLYDSTKVEPPRWLIKGLLPESCVAIIPGQWGSYKTTTALDMALSAMTSKPFAGHYRIKRTGAVIYFALEGTGTIQSRLAAIAKQRGAPDKLPFAWRGDCPLLTAKDAGPAIVAHYEAAAAYFKRTYGVPTVLVLIDTYAVAAGFSTSGDDNDTAATMKAFTTLRFVHKHTGAAVGVVDHFGKMAEAGTRGSSSKEGNADAVLATLADKDLNGSVSNTRLAVRKQRDGISGFELPFTPQVIDLGLDEDGDPVTAVVLDWGSARKPATASRKNPDVTLLCKVLADTVAKKGFPFQPDAGGPTVQACHSDELRDAFFERRLADGTAKQKRDARQAAYRRALKAAVAAALIGARDIDSSQQVLWPKTV
jgi:hypothetical protein